MMNTWCVDGLLYVHAVVDYVCNNTQHRIDDGWTTRTANGEPETPILTQDDRWGHRRKWSLSWRHCIPLPLNQTIQVWRARLCGEIIHFVIQEESGSPCHRRRAIRVIQRVGVCHRITVCIDDSEMRRVVRLITRWTSSPDLRACRSTIRIN